MEKSRCDVWLEKILSDGEIHLCDDVRAEAKREGFTMTELKMSRRNLGVKTYHQFDEYGDCKNWFWYLEV